MGAEHGTPGQLTDDQTAALELKALAQSLERRDDLVQLGAAGVRQCVRGDRIRAQEQQPFEGALELAGGGHAVILRRGGRSRAITRSSSAALPPTRS